jgi:Glycosyltransferase
MKLAYIYATLSTVGGGDRVIAEKANYFAEKCGYEVYIITAYQNGLPFSFPLSPKVKHLDLGIDFNEQYQYSFLKRGYIYLKLLRKYKKELSDLLCQLKVDFTMTTISREIDFLADLKDGSQKIAEAHVSKKFIRNLHDLQKKSLPYRIIGRIWTRKIENILNRFDELVVLTEADAANWQAIRSTTVIPNSLPFYPTESSNCTNKKIISVGRLDNQKGFDLLIDAWEIVAARHPDWSISIYGEGGLYHQLNEQIKQKGLTSSFKIENPVKNITEKYTESSIYVMSSRFEGFGMVLIEAMACGLPVISFNCPSGPSEIISDQIDGFLVENGNIYELSEKILFLIENEDKRIQMGQIARDNIQRYTADNVMRKWVNLFASLKDNLN